MSTEKSAPPEHPIKDAYGDAPSPFVTGGTLPLTAPSYVVRQADSDLYDGLRRGEFCYVLNTRQMGKSSLMVRTAARLRAEARATVCILDLTAIGQNLTPAQWYGGLLSQVGLQLEDYPRLGDDIESEMDRCWQSLADLGPMQRFFAVLERVALPAVPTSLVIFVDEVDATRSLPFPADEFFAGIRECYNRRVTNPGYERLTFCLLGVATPAQLISDDRMSPFNIGRRIRLSDFTLEEAAPLARDLPGGLATLKRALHWTGGHPYLTQRLLRASAESAESPTPDAVDRLCQRLFLTKDSRETDDNLTFVRSRLLRGHTDLAALLDLYRRVRSGRKVRDDETNALCATLRLSGVVRVDEKGFLTVRNRIYDHVFDNDWVEAHLPGAELRRQKAAFQRGVLRAASIGAAAAAVMAGLVWVAVRQAAEARRLEHVAQERLSQMTTQNAIRLLQDGDVLSALPLLEEAARLDARGLPERATASRLRLSIARLQAPQEVFQVAAGSPVLALDVSPDETRFVTGTEGGVVRVWDARNGAPVTPEMRHRGAVRSVAFRPDGRALASAGDDGTGRIWDASAGTPLTPALRYHTVGTAGRVDWSPSGRLLALSGTEGPSVWDATTGREMSRVWDVDTGHWSAETLGYSEARAVAFAPDESRLAFVTRTYLANFADPKTGKMNGILRQCYNGNQVAYSPDGARLVIAGAFGAKAPYGASDGAFLYDGKSGERLARLVHPAIGSDARFSRDGKRLATVSQDGTARVWDAKGGRPLTPPLPSTGTAVSVRFRADGGQIVVACQDGTARVWEVATGRQVGPPLRHDGPLWGAQFVGAGVLTAGTDGVVRLWWLADPDAASRRIAPASGASVAQRYAYSRVGTSRRVALAVEPARGQGPLGAVSLHDTETGASLFPLPAGPPPGSFRALSLSGEYACFEFPDAIEVHEIRARRVVIRVPRKGGSPTAPGLTCFAHDSFAILKLAERGGPVERIFRLPSGEEIPVPTPTQNDSVWWSPSADSFRRLPRPGGAQYMTKDLSPQGRYLILGSAEPSLLPADRRDSLILWDAQEDHSYPLNIRPLQLNRSVFSPDERYLVLLQRETTLLDVPTGKQIARLSPNGGRVSVAAFSANSRHVLTGGEDGLARLWDAATGKLLLPPLLHGGAIVAVDFRPDGRVLATASADGSVRLWDAATGEPLGIPLRQANAIQQVFFTPDGKRLVVAGQDEIRAWVLPAE